MAKKAKTDDNAEAPGPTGTQTITIKGCTFTMPAPYTEGHVISANEAQALNSLLGENIRNNFSSHVTKAREEAASASGGDAKTLTLAPEVMADLQAKFDAYAQSYSFGAKRTARAPADPVAREAHKIAKAKLLEHLKKNGQDPKSVDAATLEKFIQQVIDKYPAIREEAQKRVDATKQIANMSIEDLLANAAE